MRYIRIQPLGRFMIFTRKVSIVPHANRGGVNSVHGQLLALSPSEEAMIKVSMNLTGSMKVTNSIIVDGDLNSSSVQQALADLQYYYAMLQCKVVIYEDNLVLEVDKDLKLPLNDHSINESCTMNEAWNTIWSKGIEKLPYKIGDPLAYFDLIRSVDKNKSAIM